MQDFRPLYLKYKTYLFPACLLLASFFVLLTIVLPQVSEIQNIRQDIEAKKSQVAKLEKTYETLSKVDDSASKTNFSILTKALPSSKDLSLIFSALTSASSIANVELSSFSLKVGDVYGDKADVASAVSGFPAITVEATIKALSSLGLVKFVEEMHKKLPLSEVKKISGVEDTTTITMSFFYKPYDLTNLSKQDQLSPISASEQQILDQLKDWDK